ncbi:class I SAM-dependent methyltransferase [Streptomyces sp. YJ-C3]
MTRERTTGDDYSDTAEFYDILQADQDRRRAARLYGARLERAEVVVDAGAGSGLLTVLALESTSATVHAVEPAAPMRALLMTRLAGLRADQRARVTVHPWTLDACALSARADLVVCNNVVPTLPPGQRHALWRGLGRALAPGGHAVLDTPPTEPPLREQVERLPRVRVGEDVFGATMTTRAEERLISVSFTYTVERDGRVIREHRDTFPLYPLPLPVLREEWRRAGLEDVACDAETLVVRRAR